MKKTAIILGATGLTGSSLLLLLLADPRYAKIKAFTRSPLNVKHEKLEEIICDLLDLDTVKDQFTGEEVFCCIGTTMKKTPDKTLYRQIDYGIPVTAAHLCKENSIPALLIISSLGANANSSIFYNKTKGEMEQAVLNQEIAHTYILQPSIIQGQRKETRIAEKIGLVIMALFQPLLIGSLKKYRAIKAETIAGAMLVLANKGSDQQIISSEEIKTLSRKADDETSVT